MHTCKQPNRYGILGSLRTRNVLSHTRVRKIEILGIVQQHAVQPYDQVQIRESVSILSSS